MTHYIKSGHWEETNNRRPKNFLDLDSFVKRITGSAIEVTKSEVDVLVAESKLKPFHLYKITGFNKDRAGDEFYTPAVISLYNDGTDSGVTVYLRAKSENEFAEDGYGEFYVPIIKKTTYFAPSNLRADSELWGVWDGDNPIVAEIPTYSIGDEVLWGGYVWKNKTGNLGSKIDDIRLNTEDWEKVPFSDSTCYTTTIDPIKVDFKADWVTERRMGSNVIGCPIDTPWQWYTSYNTIALFPWHLVKFSEDYYRENNIYPNVGSDAASPYIKSCNISTPISLVNFKGIQIDGITDGSSYQSDFEVGGLYLGYGSIVYDIDRMEFINCAFIGNNRATTNAIRYCSVIRCENVTFKNFKFASTTVNNIRPVGIRSVFAGSQYFTVENSGSTIFEDKLISGVEFLGGTFLSSALDFTASTLFIEVPNNNFANSVTKEVIYTSNGNVKIRTIDDAGVITLSNLNA